MVVLVQSFINVVPLLIALWLGYVLGKRGYVALSKAITPVIWVILGLIGMQSAAVLTSMSVGLALLSKATLYASVLSMLVFVGLLPLNSKHASAQTRWSWALLWFPLKECVLAFSMIGLGVGLYLVIGDVQGWPQHFLELTYWIYALVFLVGVELSTYPVNQSWLSWKLLRIPLIVLLCSLLGGVVLALLDSESIFVALALSSGFGWFSLSGALAADYLGSSYGAFAVLVNLIRELIGLTLVLLMGRSYAASGIGVCGATALDTTLPFIRKGCDQHWLPAAIVCGLVLTLVAPVLMLIFFELATTA